MKQYSCAVSCSVWQFHALPDKGKYFHEQWITSVQQAGEAGPVGAGRVPVSGEWDIRTAVMSGEWDQHLVLLQVAAEGLCRSSGAAGEPFCGDDAGVAVTVRITGAELYIHSGAGAATVEAVLRVLKSC